MADLVEEVLKAEAEKYKSIEVKKNLELDIDVGNLLAVDNNPIDLKEYRLKKHDYLTNLARDNTQLLINKIWQLPVERVEDAVIAKLSPPTTVLPREKPVPKPKLPTKWEQYAKAKGIQKRNKSKLIWDEGSKDWKPRWGYRRGNDDTKDWLIEVPVNADPYEDQFEKRKEAKKERIAKNELQRLRNLARTKKGKVPGIGLTPTENPSTEQISKAVALAKKSTASVGKFQDKLPDEKPLKNQGKKRKFAPLVVNMKEETKKNLSILEAISSKQPKLDVEKAVNRQIYEDDQQKKHEKQSSGNKRGGKTSRQSGGKRRRKDGGNKVGKKKRGKGRR